MHLKKIEIYGFKSFADKVQLEFEDGITAIVGPNGSGKSNIADAVRWVLGEQSAKNLRGGKMEDIIFAGTQKRKPLGYAEVSLIIDNNLGKLPIDYNEVRITRRVFRSGESEFYINKSSCRLKDIHQLFMDTGLGKEGYSIIGQGKIDEILSASSQDRRFIFEEAAGIVKFKARKNEAEKKLQKTKDNLIRVDDIIRELENQLGPLSIQSKTAQEYISIKEELKEKELALFIHKMDSLREKHDGIYSDKNNILEQIEEHDKNIQEKEHQDHLLKNRLEEIEEYSTTMQKKLYDMHSDIEKKHSEIKITKNIIENLNQNRETLIVEMNKINENIKQNTRKEKTKKQELNNLISWISDQEKSIQEKREKLSTLKSTLKMKESNIDEKRQEKIELINTLSDFKSNLNGVNIMKNNIDKQLKQMNDHYNDLCQQIEVQNKKYKDQEKNKSMREEELKNIQNTQKTINEEFGSIDVDISTLNSDIEKITKNIQSKQSRLKILQEMENDYDGYYKSVKKLMLEKDKNKYLDENMFGVIAEIINVPNPYVVAIEKALGSTLQNIVVKDEFVAQECIKILNHNKWGRATFLPLEIIKGKKVVNELNFLKEQDGFLGIASDLIQYQSKFASIIENLLGRVIIVQEVKDGILLSRRLKHRFKIVTLDGEIFNPGGSIVGGKTLYNNSGILSRQKEVKDIQADLKTLQEQYTVLNERIIQLQNKKNEIEKNLEVTIKKINEKEISLININNILQQMKTEKERIANEKLKLNNDIQSFDLEMNELEKKERKLKEEVFAVQECIDKINLEINNSNNNHQDEKEKIDEISSVITQLEIEMAKTQQKKVDTKNQILQLSNYTKGDKDSLQEKEEKKHDYQNKIQDNNYRIEELTENISRLLKGKHETEVEIEKINEEKEALSKKVSFFQEKLRDLNKQYVVSNNALHKTEVQLNKVQMEMDTLQDKIYEEYQLNYNLALGYKREINNVSTISTEIQNYKNQMKGLGHVNVDSIQEYKKVSERFDFLTKQKEDLDTAEKSLNKVINEITITMEKQFKEQFDIINNEFNKVFQKLFVGGKAGAYLIEPENPLESGVEIEVQPPGKKLQHLSLLSGGERALTAIALLFAILQVKPTPFCILDEIEAALDDANVYRYAEFLQNFSKNTQFIAVTHRKGTMESANTLYGITMAEQGVSKLVSAKLKELVC